MEFWSLTLPVATETIMFAGSYYQALYRHDREAAKQMVLVVEGKVVFGAFRSLNATTEQPLGSRACVHELLGYPQVATESNAQSGMGVSQSRPEARTLPARS